MPPHKPTPGGGSARDQIAAQRAAARRARARNRLMLAAGAIVVVVAVVVVFVIIKVTAPRSASGSGGPTLTGPALHSVVAQATGVPATTLSQVGAGSATSHPTPIGRAGGTPAAPPLTLNGKPELLYVGGEFCPYCAAQRWPMITALSRFGTLTGLATVKSGTVNGQGTQEPYPNTSTWTFVHATYTSKYLAFTPVELYSTTPDPSTGGYTALQKPTAAQQELLTKYDAPPYVPSDEKGAIPFLYYGGKFLSIGAYYDPGLLQGLTWAQIGTDLHNPSSAVARGVLGAANYMTAALCELTGNQPATACTPSVRSLQSHL